MNDILNFFEAYRDDFLNAIGITLDEFQELSEAEKTKLLLAFKEMPEIKTAMQNLALKNAELVDETSGFNLKKTGLNIITGGVYGLFDKTTPVKDRITGLLTGGAYSGRGSYISQKKQDAARHPQAPKNTASAGKSLDTPNPNATAETEEKQGLSTYAMIGIGAGGLLVIGLLVYLILK